MQDKFVLDLIKDATTDDLFGLKGVAVTDFNKLQELSLLIMSRTVNLNTFSEIIFDEIFKAVEISNSKTTGCEQQWDLLYLLTFISNIWET